MKLKEYIGQEDIKKDIMIHLEKSIETAYPLEHTMFYGRAGFGKTTLAELIASLRGKRLLQKTGDELTKEILYKIFQEIQNNEILFVDETHNIPVKAMEILYGPLQIINNTKLNNKENLPFIFQGHLIEPFTFMGATTAPGTITKPLRERIILSYEMQPYTLSELQQMLINKGCKPSIAMLIAERSRGTPRLAMNYFVRIRNEAVQSEERCLEVFQRLKIDGQGFSKEDVTILKYLQENGAVGESELYRTLGIDRKDYMNMYEPFLLEKGMIRITSKGRILTRKGENYCGVF